MKEFRLMRVLSPRNLILFFALIILAITPLFGCSMMSAMHGAATYTDPKTPCEINYKSEGGRMSSGGIKTSTHVIFRNVKFTDLFNATVSAISEYKYTVNSSSESSGMITASYDAGLGSGIQARIMVQLKKEGNNKTNMSIRVTAPALFADIPGDCCDVVKSVETQLNVKASADNQPVQQAQLRIQEKPQAQEEQRKIVPQSIAETKTEEQPASVVKVEDQRPASTATDLIVSVTKANVRLLPSLGSKVITHLKRGDTVVLVKNSGNWYLIELPDGATGWSYDTDFLSMALTADAANHKTHKVQQTIQVPTKNGSIVRIIDIRKASSTKKLSSNDYLIQSNDDYDIVFFDFGKKGRSFLISIKNADVEDTRKKAEANFLLKLNITEQQACQLKVTESYKNPNDPYATVKNFEPSFCE
jgi:uncharacterized protein YgiM (DUF1202 family)